MTFTAHHGVSYHSGSAIQSTDRTYEVSVSETLGMVNGVTEIIDAKAHTKKNSGSVTGKGDVTISPGVGDPGVAGFTGGKTIITKVNSKENLGQEAEWSADFTHYPHAA